MQLLSLVAFGLAGLLAVSIGVRYFVTREFMPYHATVVNQPWSALEPRLQAIILGMLQVAGAGLAGCGCAVLWLLLPLQRGEAWAAWAAASILLVAIGPILSVLLGLQRISPEAKTPVVPTVAGLALVVVGTLAFFAGRV